MSSKKKNSKITSKNSTTTSLVPQNNRQMIFPLFDLEPLLRMGSNSVNVEKELSKDYKKFVSKKGFIIGYSSVASSSVIHESDGINQYRNKLGVNAFCIDINGGKELMMMNVPTEVLEALGKDKRITLELIGYQRAKCNIEENGESYQKECDVRHYSDYKKSYESYQSISYSSEYRMNHGDDKKQKTKETKDKKGKEKNEYTLAIFKNSKNTSRQDMGDTLIRILDEKNL